MDTNTEHPQFGHLLGKSPTASDFLDDIEGCNKKSPMVSDKFGNQICAMPLHKFITPVESLLTKLSFSHLCEIMTQKDPLARFFYETECIKGTWSVKELRRQIATNLYFRSGVSKDPKKLLSTLEPETNTPALTIRQPFTFEFY